MVNVSDLLRANEISKSFKGFKALQPLSLSITEGECYALLGPNGAGKSTTIDILTGLQNPDSGSVEIFGQNYSKNKKSIYEKIGVVLQETRLYRKFTVLETINLFRSFYQDVHDANYLIDLLQLQKKKSNNTFVQY